MSFTGVASAGDGVEEDEVVISKRELDELEAEVASLQGSNAELQVGPRLRLPLTQVLRLRPLND
jgi:hypothetical protein